MRQIIYEIHKQRIIVASHRGYLKMLRNTPFIYTLYSSTLVFDVLYVFLGFYLKNGNI